MLIKSLCRKLPVIKVVEISDFTNEKRWFLFWPIWEAPLSPTSSVLRQISFFLFQIIWSLLFWNVQFFFSLYNLFIPSSCTPLQPCLINPAWEHASHHPFTNSSLLKLSKVGMAWFFSLLCIFTTILPLPGMFFPPFPPGPMLSLFLFFIWTKEDGSVRKSPPNSYQGYEG